MEIPIISPGSHRMILHAPPVRIPVRKGKSALITSLRHEFEKLDDLVPALITNADFVKDYKNSRQIKG